MAKEQFLLARKLEELQARLALGTSKDSIRPLGSEVQEEGKDPGAGRWGRSTLEATGHCP